MQSRSTIDPSLTRNTPLLLRPYRQKGCNVFAGYTHGIGLSAKRFPRSNKTMHRNSSSSVAEHTGPSGRARPPRCLSRLKLLVCLRPAVGSGPQILRSSGWDLQRSKRAHGSYSRLTRPIKQIIDSTIVVQSRYNMINSEF